MTERDENLGDGERAERRRRRRFWGLVATLLLAGMIAGGVAGFFMQQEAANGTAVLTPTLAWVAIIVMAALFIALCWIYAVSIDEVDLLDNLWASTAGFYVYAILYPSWVGLAAAKAAPPVDHMAIFFTSVVGGTLAYLYRKWRAR